ncbi:hypothetical protein [Yinghuangia sp. YIM S09857]|uniref:hypothetical protein n=1 Tax=Yinghuangia sp. YIM S09857 TaxID=3436929 RepID=UPI003F539E69
MTVNTTAITRRSRLILPTAAAGYVHAAAWIAALGVGMGKVPELGDDNGAIATAYADNGSAAVVQSVLTHGIAAAAIAVVAMALLNRGRRLAGWTAAVASVLAFGQLVLEQGAIAASDPDRAGGLFNLALRVDGVKMFAFAAVAVLTVPLLARSWQRGVAYATAAAITLSGVGYLLLVPSLGAAAMLSLPLLLVWFAVLAVRLSRGTSL